MTEQLNAFSSFLKIKMKETERDPRRTSYIFISKKIKRVLSKKDASFCSVRETRPSMLSFYSLKETQASGIRDFHDL